MPKCVECGSLVIRDVRRQEYYCKKCNRTFSDFYVLNKLYQKWVHEQEYKPFVFR